MGRKKPSGSGQMSLVLAQTTKQLDMKLRRAAAMGNKMLLEKRKKQTLSKLLRNTEGSLSTKLKQKALPIFGIPDATEDDACDYY